MRCTRFIDNDCGMAGPWLLRPFRAPTFLCSDPQGVALGYHVAAPLGRITIAHERQDSLVPINIGIPPRLSIPQVSIPSVAISITFVPTSSRQASIVPLVSMRIGTEPPAWDLTLPGPVTRSRRVSYRDPSTPPCTHLRRRRGYSRLASWRCPSRNPVGLEESSYLLECCVWQPPPRWSS